MKPSIAQQQKARESGSLMGVEKGVSSRLQRISRLSWKWKMIVEMKEAVKNGEGQMANGKWQMAPGTIQE